MFGLAVNSDVWCKVIVYKNGNQLMTYLGLAVYMEITLK
jgi:hypothetical protein